MPVELCTRLEVLFHEVIERLHEFVSEDEFTDALRLARREFVTLRGDLFDSDSDYEARLGVFLDWFLSDRTVKIDGQSLSPVQYFINKHHADLAPDVLAWLEAFRDSSLRLLLCKKVRKDGSALFEDVVLNVKVDVMNAVETFIALERKQLVEARLVDNCGEFLVSPYWLPRPHEGLKLIQKSAKQFRSSFGHLDLESPDVSVELLKYIHRIAGLSNRANRYPHVQVIEIFEELREAPLA